MGFSAQFPARKGPRNLTPNVGHSQGRDWKFQARMWSFQAKDMTFSREKHGKLKRSSDIQLFFKIRALRFFFRASGWRDGSACLVLFLANLIVTRTTPPHFAGWRRNTEPGTGNVWTVLPGTERRTGTSVTVFQKRNRAFLLNTQTNLAFPVEALFLKLIQI